MFSRRQDLGHPHKPTAAEGSLPEKPALIKVNGCRGRGARPSSRPHLPSSQRKPAPDLPARKGSTFSGIRNRRSPSLLPFPQVLASAEQLDGADLASPVFGFSAILALGWPGGSSRGR